MTRQHSNLARMVPSLILPCLMEVDVIMNAPANKLRQSMLAGSMLQSISTARQPIRM